MNSRAMVVGLLPFVLLLPSLSFAESDKAVPFTIVAGRQDARAASPNRLVIPRRFLEETRTAGAANALDLRTLIAGLAISLSVVCLVFLILRKNRRAASAAAILFGVFGLGFLWGGQASADGPPPATRISADWDRYSGEDGKSVVVEVTDEGDTVKLVLNTRFRSEYYQRLRRNKERARLRHEQPDLFQEPPISEKPAKTLEKPLSDSK